LALAFHELGILLGGQRRYAEAQAVAERGIAAVPDVPELWLLLGGLHLNRADPVNAKAAFERVLGLAPGHPRALHGLGTALLYEGAFAPAAEQFRQVLARDPRHVRARLDLGHCLLELGRADEAAACLRLVVQTAPPFYGKALRTMVAAGRGRFFLKRSAAAAYLRKTNV
jgi:cytochrome c-type biogenesis protein CcmH/NrfG